MKDKKNKKIIEVECELCTKFRKGIDEATDMDSIFGADDGETIQKEPIPIDHGEASKQKHG